jgi:phage virion morphogenesis protein
MPAEFTVTINDQALTLTLERLKANMDPAPLLNIAANVMRGSFDRTFREQGSPAGSWKPLAAWTRTGAANKIHYRKGKLLRGRTARGAALEPGRLMLIKSGRLKNSITYQVTGNQLVMGSNLKYAAIQQLGGVAGRKGPFKKKDGRRPYIPARPYLVFRPEDPQRIAAAMERYLDARMQQSEK